jgi:hypothetical protein
MGFFGFGRNRGTGKSLLTQAQYIRHHLYHKIRHVFPYGTRGEQKVDAVNTALDIKHQAYHSTPKLMHPLEEDDAKERLDRLAHAGMITPTEAAKVEQIISEDLHPGSKH